MKRVLTLASLALLSACKQDPCEGGADEPTLTIGYGVAGEFWEYEAGEPVTLTKAPQGGFGVPVRARIEGLRTVVDEQGHAPLEVLLETWLDGEVSASFLNTGATGYCQEDGSGLVWDLVVGFDTSAYSTVDDLVTLDGMDALLVVEATDIDGNSADSELDVVIEVE